jgi:hypothetical protein
MASGDKMADYYPMISRAIAGLARDASAERQALYNRMREALSAALRTAEPAFTEFQVMRERLALEDAISRAEGEVGGRDLADDAEDIATAVEIPWMILTGDASGRFNRVWRYAWR